MQTNTHNVNKTNNWR